jgi:hypothetical protein
VYLKDKKLTLGIATKAITLEFNQQGVFSGLVKDTSN